MSFTFEFEPWGSFRARKKQDVIRSWLQRVARLSREAFEKGMKSYPPSSSPGAYPSIRTGALKRSIQTEVTSNSVTIGTNMFYSKYLRKGTVPMKGRRKMSDNALEEGLARAGRMGKWVEWSRGS